MIPADILAPAIIHRPDCAVAQSEYDDTWCECPLIRAHCSVDGTAVVFGGDALHAYCGNGHRWLLVATEHRDRVRDLFFRDGSAWRQTA